MEDIFGVGFMMEGWRDLLMEQKERYATLLEDIVALCTQMMGSKKQVENRERLLFFWEVGNRLQQAAADAGEEDAVLGRALVRQLSADLTQQFGEGFSTRNVFYAQKLAKKYERQALRDELTWSHYKALLAVKEDAERERLAAEAVRMGMSEKRLQTRVRQLNSQRAVARHQVVLRRRHGEPHLYAVESVERAGKRQYRLDCGFLVKRELPFRRTGEMVDGTVLRCRELRGSVAATRVECEAGARFCYWAEVVRVIDGDTLVLEVDLGMDLRMENRFRLRGVDVPELETKEGLAARRFVMSKLQVRQRILVLTHGTERYGRYLVDVFYNGDVRGRGLTLSTGTFLNEELVERGYGAYWELRE